MSKIDLDAYLFFDGNCREAMEFYQSIFGGKLDIMTYGQVPNTRPENKDKVIHANLNGGEIHLMASDSGTGPVTNVARVQISLSGGDETKLRDIFEKLSQGGTVKSELQKAFFGALHGSVKDKFGIDWMITIGQPGNA
jgi:PhnB protein